MAVILSRPQRVNGFEYICAEYTALIDMMTSWHARVFRIISYLCGGASISQCISLAKG